MRGVLVLLGAVGAAMPAAGFLSPLNVMRQGVSSGVARGRQLSMNREWLSDAFQQIPDSEIERIHNYLDNKGKNVIRGPTTIAGPDGTLVNVNENEEVEIIDGVVIRTYLSAMPAVNEQRLKAENKVLLEIKWKENWETDGFSIEVFGTTGPECLQYTQRFCEATGAKIAGDIKFKANYYEVPLQVANNNIIKLQAIQAGTATLDL